MREELFFMLEVEFLIKTFGYIGLFAIIFAETGLFLGFFLPGDSLLFTGGILASQGVLNIIPLCLVVFAASIIGNTVSYIIGNRFGRRLFRKEDSLFFHKNHLVLAERFYEKHGGKAVVLARFMPIIRTFAPVVAGIGRMHFPTFFIYTVIGGALWALGLPVLGFFLGKAIPNIDIYLLPIIGAIVIVSIAPGIYHVTNTKEKRQKLYTIFRHLILRSQK